MRAEALKGAEAWLKKARSDMRTIEILLEAEDAPFDSVCFYQQAAEKYLRHSYTTSSYVAGMLSALYWRNHAQAGHAAR
jgi:hypothetical protein